MPSQPDQLTPGERRRELAVNFETNPEPREHDPLLIASVLGRLRPHLIARNIHAVVDILKVYFETPPNSPRLAPSDLPDYVMLYDLLDVRLCNALYAVGIATVGDARQKITKDFHLKNFSERSVQTVMRAVGTWEDT